MKTNKLIKYLQENYPSLVNETEDGNLEVNFNKLKEELNDVNISEETYGLNWMGKSYARVLRDYPVTTLIEPDNKHNNLEENKDSNNVYIEGDNLEVLKHLKNAYSNKIKMIYIDPPYNTGSDGFVYNDTFNFKVEDFMQLANVDEDEAKKILDYTTSERSSHSAWLTFMYPRLYIARELLKDDGVIFISIDDNEQAQLKLLCDQIFGEDNFISQFIWQKKSGGGSNTNFYEGHESLLIYVKDFTKFEGLKSFKKSKEKEVNKDFLRKVYGSYNNDSRLLDLYEKYPTEICQHRNIMFEELDILLNENIIKQEKYDEIKKKVESGEYFLQSYNDKFNIICKYDDKETKGMYSIINGVFSSVGKDDFIELFGELYFSNPKPVDYLVKFMEANLGEEDIVLDFFGGSGTTAEAIMNINFKMNLKIRYILIQLGELIVKKEKVSKQDIEQQIANKAYDFCKKELKSKNPMIPDIAKERIKRAAKKIKEENKDKEYINDIDFGFKVYKTIEDKRTKLSDIKEFDVNQKLLFDTDNLEALLTTWMLYDGYDLNTKVENFSINKYNGYLVESTLYLMDKDFSTKDLKTLVEKLSDEQTPIINRIVINEANFTNKMLAEINEQVFDKNIKEVNINVIKRV